MLTVFLTSCEQKYGASVSREVGPVYAFAFLAVIQNKAGKFKLMSYEGWNFNSGNYLFTTDTK